MTTPAPSNLTAPCGVGAMARMENWATVDLVTGTHRRPQPHWVLGVRPSTSQQEASSRAVLDDGSVVCWGRNDYGQLGDGTLTNRNTPTQTISLGRPAVAIEAGVISPYVHSSTTGLSPAGDETTRDSWAGVTRTQRLISPNGHRR